MTRINLLPWRELRRKEQDRQVLRVSIFAWVLMGLIVLYAFLHINAVVDNQNKRNEFLTQEINRLSQEIKDIQELKKKRDALVARMEVIQRLQQDRTQIVHILDDLVRKLPNGVYLTQFKKDGHNITLVGVAQSNARVSTFMRNLDASDWFTNPNLDVINVAEQGGERVSRFTLRVVEVDKTKKAADAEAAVTPAPAPPAKPRS